MFRVGDLMDACSVAYFIALFFSVFCDIFFKDEF